MPEGEDEKEKVKEKKKRKIKPQDYLLAEQQREKRHEIKNGKEDPSFYLSSLFFFFCFFLSFLILSDFFPSGFKSAIFLNPGPQSLERR